MLLYAPLYLSNHCINHCTYCGFRHPQQIERIHLNFEQGKAEADILIGRGFRHILVLGGDFPRLTTPEYYAETIRYLSSQGVAAAVEIAPLTTAGYAKLVEAGACGVTLYQETYDQERYAEYHPRGTKAAYDWRFEGLDRAAEAGMRRLGLGVLLGLAEPRQELAAMMRHAAYLSARYPECTVAFSLPRIHDAPGEFQTPFLVDDDLFIRFYCVLRLAFPDAPLVLSTRKGPPCGTGWRPSASPRCRPAAAPPPAATSKPSAKTLVNSSPLPTTAASRLWPAGSRDTHFI